VLSRLLLGASVAWLALLTVTVLAAHPALTAIVGRFSSFICHQEPDRTFHIGNSAWAVCARCLGLYSAAPIGALMALTIAWRPVTARGNFLLLCIAGVPTGATWLAEHALGWPMTNVIRFAAALPLGAAVAWVMGYTLSDARRG
jgi:uncharacterized membrane protein